MFRKVFKTITTSIIQKFIIIYKLDILDGELLVSHKQIKAKKGITFKYSLSDDNTKVNGLGVTGNQKMTWEYFIDNDLLIMFLGITTSNCNIEKIIARFQ